ncbi:MAG: hypothetical protein JMJ93_01725 [Synergistaceae bacterium]|nr:hypothetical protein [Synergistaceae bacterium]
MTMRYRWMTVFLVWALALVVLAAPASAATWHVSPSGTDDPAFGRDPAEGAFRTLQYALDRAGEGDEIVVGPGLYEESLVITAGSLRIRSLQGAARTILDGGGAPSALAVRASGLVFEGFTVTGAEQGLLFEVPQGDDVSIVSCLFDGLTAQAIHFSAPLDGAETIIEKNVFLGGGAFGISLAGQSLGGDIARGAATALVIDDNDFIDLTGGISLGRIVRGTVEITANDFIDCLSFGLVVEEMGSAAEPVEVTISDNRFAVNGPGGGTALYLGNAERTTEILRNQIRGAFSYGIRLQRLGYLGSSRTRVTVAENVLSGTGTALAVDSLFPLLPGEVAIERNHLYENDEGFRLVEAKAARFDASTVTVRNNNFAGNGIWALRNDAAVDLDARNNWWGDETGPKESEDNPGGQGDGVTGNVLYAPWLREAFTGTEESESGGCALGFSPWLAALALPLLFLGRRGSS